MSRAWKQVGTEIVNKKVYGDVGVALVRPTNFLLLFIRTLKPGVKHYSRTGIYAVIHEGQQIAKRVYYGNAPPIPPTRWADREIRNHLKGRSQ